MSNNIDVLKIGENEYTKIKYFPLEMAEVATKYIDFKGERRSDDLNKLFREAMLKVSVNGHLFKNESDINQHFSKCPGEIRAVRLWALMEGLTSFLESFAATPDLEAKYQGYKEEEETPEA